MRWSSNPPHGERCHSRLTNSSASSAQCRLADLERLSARLSGVRRILICTPGFRRVDWTWLRPPIGANGSRKGWESANSATSFTGARPYPSTRTAQLSFSDESLVIRWNECKW
jgi:hypothetical protein